MIKASQNGKNQISGLGVFHIHCNFDISYFPFDRQLCIVRVESANYVVELQMLLPGRLLISSGTDNEKWEIFYGFTRETNFTSGNGNTYAAIEFGFYMQRKSLFYGIAMMLPLVASSLIELSTFVFEIDDVNRLQLSFTCFLSFTFFISILTEKLPQNSENIPYLLITVGVMVASVCLVILSQAISFYISSSEKLLFNFTSKEQSRKVAKTIDKITIVFYSSVIIVSQVFIPSYAYLLSR